MNKYETRAKELVSTLFEGEPCTWEEDSIENDFLKLMLQLAEEVEYSTNVEWIKSMKNSNIYTKERVEELLQKQRELTLGKATVCLRKYGKDITEEDYGQEVASEIEQEYWGIYAQSILNAKLKID